MKTYILTIITLFSMFTICTSFKQQSTGTLQVTVTSIKNSKGEIGFALFNKSDGFPDESEAFKNLRGKVVNGTCTILFNNIPFGNYAIGIYHDENSNKKFDETWYGMPKEGVGVSNNPKVGVFSPPTFETAQFKVKSSSEGISIKIKYL